MGNKVIKKIKFSSDFKAVCVMVGIVLIIVSCYAIAWFYEDYVGEIEVEVAYSVEVEEVVETVGYVIRDEYQEVDGEVVSILYTSDDAFYYPIISDATSVTKGGVLAYTFANEENAQLYYESLLIEEQIDYLSSVASIYDVQYLDINTTIEQINEDVLNYIDMINSNDLSEISTQAREINSQILTKKVIMGETYDFSSDIQSLELSLASLQSSINIIDEIQAPYAGYFVSSVDGYESLVDFDTIEEIGLDSDTVTSLINSEAVVYENAFGKIIAQHTWYMACNLDTNVVLSSQLSFTVGSTVYVDFTDDYIYQIPMQIVSVSSYDGDGNIAVLLKCTYMNENLSNLRIENVSFSVQTYEGLKINSDAVFVNEDGITGVYTLVNKTVVFTPITILKTELEYVVATAYTADKDDYKDYAQLTVYDQIIVKGRNLIDGKIID